MSNDNGYEQQSVKMEVGHSQWRKAPPAFNEDGSIRKNKYGNVDLRSGVPAGLSHVSEHQYRGRNIYAICRRLGIRWASALVGFSRDPSGPCDPKTEEPMFWKPVRDGIVIPSTAYDKLMAELERRRKMDRERLERNRARQQRKADGQRNTGDAKQEGGLAI